MHSAEYVRDCLFISLLGTSSKCSQTVVQDSKNDLQVQLNMGLVEDQATTW